MPKYNWQEIKDQYVLAPSKAERPSLEALAARYGCSPSNLREKASAEGWKVEAERYLQTVEDKRQGKKSTELAVDLAAFDAQVFKIAKMGVRKILAHFEAEIPDNPISPNSLEKLAASLERFQKIGKAALGEDSKLNLQIDYGNLSDEQLQRLVAGEDPKNVVAS